MRKRLTSARAIILETLNTRDKHWTTQEVYEHVRARLPSINISTVYRALEYLSINGWISVSDLGTGTPEYEALAEEPHHHIVCQECEDISELRHEFVEEFFAAVSRENKFVVRTNHLILFGTCETCRKLVEM